MQATTTPPSPRGGALAGGRTDSSGQDQDQLGRRGFAQDGIGGHASRSPKHDSGTSGTSPALDPTTCDHILQQAGGRY